MKKNNFLLIMSLFFIFNCVFKVSKMSFKNDKKYCKKNTLDKYKKIKKSFIKVFLDKFKQKKTKIMAIEKGKSISGNDLQLFIQDEEKNEKVKEEIIIKKKLFLEQQFKKYKAVLSSILESVLNNKYNLKSPLIYESFECNEVFKCNKPLIQFFITFKEFCKKSTYF